MKNKWPHDWESHQESRQVGGGGGSDPVVSQNFQTDLGFICLTLPMPSNLGAGPNHAVSQKK